MRFLYFAAAALVALGLPFGVAHASMVSYSQLYVFGDSLSDVGNIYELTDHNVPVSPPYAQGRFTNGKVWVQYLAEDLGLGPVTASLNGGNDFAYGAAQTGQTIAHKGLDVIDLPALDLTAQQVQYQASAPAPASDALYTLWIGANDIFAFINLYLDGELAFSDAGTFISQATSNVGVAVESLADSGMNHMLALNLPDLSKTPEVMAAASTTENPSAALAQVSDLTRMFNAALASRLQDAAKEKDFDLTLVDTFTRVNQAAADPQAFGFSNVTDPCWTGTLGDPLSGIICSHPEDYLFWDDVHPTWRGHQLMAELALATLRTDATSVPEPGSGALFLFAILVMGATLARRRRSAAAAKNSCAE